MKHMRFLIIVTAIILATLFIFQIELFAHEFRRDFFYRGDWLSLIMVMFFVIAIGGTIKILAGMTARRRKK